MYNWILNIGMLIFLNIVYIKYIFYSFKLIYNMICLIDDDDYYIIFIEHQW